MFGSDVLLAVMTIVACLVGAIGYFKGVEHGKDEAFRLITYPVERGRRHRKR